MYNDDSADFFLKEKNFMQNFIETNESENYISESS